MIKSVTKGCPQLSDFPVKSYPGIIPILQQLVKSGVCNGLQKIYLF
jgi:hypothetical protein